jgi:hypothetical protein
MLSPSGLSNRKPPLLSVSESGGSMSHQNGLTAYTPLQISLSLEKALNQYALLEIAGCDGYKKLKKISERKI